MSQFCEREYFGYKFAPRPGKNDRYRTKPGVVVPWQGICLIPYHNGSDIMVRLKITRTRSATPVPSLKYKWSVLAKDKGTNWPNRNGNGVVIIPNRKDFVNLDLYLGHFPYTGEYEFVLEVEVDGEKESHTLVDYEFFSLAQMILSCWWIVLSAAIGFVLGKLVS